MIATTVFAALQGRGRYAIPHLPSAQIIEEPQAMRAPQPIGKIVDRHVSAEDPDAIEINVDACLLILTMAEAAPGEYARARHRLRQVGDWFTAQPAQVQALIDDLAAMDPLRRTRRRAVLVEAWSHLLIG